jgi:hypothetical protein
MTDTDTLTHPPKPADVGLGPDHQPAGHSDRFAHEETPPGVGELVKSLRDEALHLLRQEANLAKTEAAEKAKFFANEGSKLATGGTVLALGGLLLLLATSYLVAWIFQGIFPALEEVGATALGFLTVGTIAALIGYSLYKAARARIAREPLTPERTVNQLKEDKQWISNKTAETTRAAKQSVAG